MAALAAIGTFLASNASTIGMVATGVGSAISAAGTIAAGKAKQQAAEFQAKQLDIKAGEEQAAGQQEAQQISRRKELAQSTLQARAAGSGFSATDPTALDLAGEIEKFGTMQEQMALYGGQSRAAGLRDAATGQRITGEAARRASTFDAAGTILGGASSMARFRNE